MPRRSIALAALAGALVAVAACRPHPPPPAAPEASQPAAAGGAPSPAEDQPRSANPGAVPGFLRKPPYLPAVPGLPPPAVQPVFPAPPPPPGGFAPGLPQGPITNYGTGGMQQMPGAPPNPPYPAGGLMH